MFHMDFLDFANVSFLPSSTIGPLCEDLNNILGQGVWYDTFQVQNIEWLWLVNDNVATINSDKLLCGCFGLYPSYVAGILKSVKEIHFYVQCSKSYITMNILKNVSEEKSAVFLIDYLQTLISTYHLVVVMSHTGLKNYFCSFYLL